VRDLTCGAPGTWGAALGIDPIDVGPVVSSLRRFPTGRWRNEEMNHAAFAIARSPHKG